MVFVKASIWIEVGVFFLEVQPSVDSALSQGSVKWGLTGTPSMWGHPDLCMVSLLANGVWWFSLFLSFLK